ncbi:DUF2470 domain-containing protein [Prochlorococcus sp. AH-716-K03]|nr:DUF2470 domain-containing protein [Prochlorococcus sp. AH-716-K03]
MKIISSKTSERVCNHMNKDHIDSVHKYLKYYGKISEFKEAFLEEITSQFMKIKYDGKSAIINFKIEISEDEIHKTLVSMIREIE